MDELRGRVRPVRETLDGTVEPVGNVGDVVRYRVREEMGIVEVLDGARVPYVEGAQGLGVFDATGELLTWWQLFTAPGRDDFVMSGGWGFRARKIIDVRGGRALLGTFAS